MKLQATIDLELLDSKERLEILDHFEPGELARALVTKVYWQRYLATACYEHKQWVPAMLPSPTDPEPASMPTVVRDTARVLTQALLRDIGLRAVVDWYATAMIPIFNGKTPMEMVSEGRTDALLAYLESLDAGAAG